MITDLVFGKAFGFCKAGYDVKGGLRDLRQMLDLSPLLSYLPWIWPITKLEAIKSVGNAHYSTSTRAEISHRITHGNTGGRHDLLQGLLEARYPDGQALPLGEITNHAYIFILAAPDTASVALRKIVMNLAQHRDIHQQLLKELSVAKLSDPPTWKELEQIPLLSAVVKETIRLHPPAGFSLPRAVPEGGRTVCGKFLPGNTTVGISAWCAHHNEDFWGADASTFRPGRWLVKEEAARLERFTLSFGQGARACLGKHVAMMQLVKATAKIVQSFDFDVVEGDKIKEVFLLLVVVDGLKVMFRRRKGGPLDDTVGMQ